jgi:hypothetical protein
MVMDAICCERAQEHIYKRILEVLKAALVGLAPEDRIKVLQHFCRLNTVFAELLTPEFIQAAVP